MSDKPEVVGWTKTYTQKGDTWDSDNDQIMIVEQHSVTEGNYWTIKTSRWAFDTIQELVDMLVEAGCTLEGPMPVRFDPESDQASDVELYRAARKDWLRDGMTAVDVYEDYDAWCQAHHVEPLALPTFGREFKDLPGVRYVKANGRVRYMFGAAE